MGPLARKLCSQPAASDGAGGLVVPGGCGDIGAWVRAVEFWKWKPGPFPWHQRNGCARSGSGYGTGLREGETPACSSRVDDPHDSRVSHPLYRVGLNKIPRSTHELEQSR